MKYCCGMNVINDCHESSNVSFISSETPELVGTLVRMIKSQVPSIQIIRHFGLATRLVFSSFIRSAGKFYFCKQSIQ